MWLEDRGIRVPPKRIMTGPRVGIDYAGAYWSARRWRFWIDLPADLSDAVGAVCRT
jgi:3-methyladenine DNA glycosylase Mpg